MYAKTVYLFHLLIYHNGPLVTNRFNFSRHRESLQSISQQHPSFCDVVVLISHVSLMLSKKIGSILQDKMDK